MDPRRQLLQNAGHSRRSQILGTISGQLTEEERMVFQPLSDTKQNI